MIGSAIKRHAGFSWLANMQLTAFVSSIRESIGPFRANRPIPAPSTYRLRWKRANALKRLAHMRWRI